jgi:hypothetical protein
MAAGLTPSLISMTDVVAMIDADEVKALADKRRGMLAAANQRPLPDAAGRLVSVRPPTEAANHPGPNWSLSVLTM